MAVRKDDVGNIDGAGQISKISRERFAPDAIDSIFQDMLKFTYFKRTDQKIGTHMTEFDFSRQKAEARMLMGSGLPDEFRPCFIRAKRRIDQK